jgi:hypothetical protein
MPDHDVQCERALNRDHEWANVQYVYELVKNEGDATCLRAFDFLLKTDHCRERALEAIVARVARLTLHNRHGDRLVADFLYSSSGESIADLVAQAREQGKT